MFATTTDITLYNIGAAFMLAIRVLEAEVKLAEDISAHEVSEAVLEVTTRCGVEELAPVGQVASYMAGHDWANTLPTPADCPAGQGPDASFCTRCAYRVGCYPDVYGYDVEPELPY